MDTVIKHEGANAAKTKLDTNDVLDIAVKGIGILASRIKAVVGEVPDAVEVQIANATEYLDMLMADPEISTEKDTYMTGVVHGALITISAHLQLLGYVEKTATAKVVAPKPKRKNNLKTGNNAQ